MVGKLFSRRAPALDAAALRALARTLAQAAPQSPMEEIRQQNQELIGALEQLRQRQEDLSRLNAELEDTNRGVVALYAELDEKADTLRRADELKSRFLSQHEPRVPHAAELGAGAVGAPARRPRRARSPRSSAGRWAISARPPTTCPSW